MVEIALDEATRYAHSEIREQEEATSLKGHKVMKARIPKVNLSPPTADAECTC